MVPVVEYKALWEHIATLVVDEHGESYFSRVIMVDDEPHLQARIAKIANKEIFLVVVTPTSDYQSSDEDNYGETDQGIIYVLKKVSLKDMSEADEMTERALTQSIMSMVKNVMKDLGDDTENDNSYTRILRQHYRGKKHTDRERNYLGCNGWSLSFGLFTNQM